MELNREKLKRMFEDTKGTGGSTNSGGGGGSLAGYATQAWVNEGFVSIDFFNRLFTVYGPGETTSDPDVVIAPNDLDSTIKNIKAMFGLWTEQYLSALGLNPGGTGSATSLGMLDDVDLTTPTNGQALVYNSTSQKWENQTISTVTALANLTDVLLTSPAANEFLMYDGTSAKWINSAIKTINGQSLYGSGDISVGGGASGNYLPLTGGTLTNANNILSLDSSTSDCWMYFKTSGRNKTSIGYYNNFSFIANESSFARIGVNNDGTPQYWTSYDGSTKYTLWHSGNMNPYLSTNRYPAYEAENSDGNWCYIRLNVYGDHYWDFATRKEGMSGYRSDKGFAIREDGTTSGLYVQYKTSSYGKLQIHVPSGESTLSFYSAQNFKWVIGYRGYDEYFGFYYGGSWQVSFSNNGTGYFNNLYSSGYVTALSDARHKTIIRDAAVSVEGIARMPAVMYQWNDGREDKELHVGSIAQNWQTILPEVVLKANDKDGTLSLQYGVAALVSCIATARRVVDHERRIADLECENKKLKGQLIRLNRYGEQ